MTIRIACRSEYNRGLAERRKYPLHTGEYKLNECGRHPQQLLDLIYELSEFQSRREFRSYSKFHDVNQQIRHAPNGLAFLIGHKLLPAIEALPGNGVPQLYIAQRMTMFVREGLRIIDELQEVADEYLLYDVNDDVQRIHTGHGSRLASPCRAILDLIDSGKRLTAFAGPLPAHHPRPTKLCNV